MQLITEAYRLQNAELHAGGSFGISGGFHIEGVERLLEMVEAKTILDYGCGTAKWIERGFGNRYDVRSYDPCVPGLTETPEPADCIVCTDVLEHIEPECLEAVLDDIKRCTLRSMILVVSTKPAKKFLSDGRNAHLIQQPCEWWMTHLMKRWRIGLVKGEKNGFYGVFLRGA